MSAGTREPAVGHSRAAILSLGILSSPVGNPSPAGWRYRHPLVAMRTRTLLVVLPEVTL